MTSSKVKLRTNINEDGTFSFDNVLTGTFTLNIINDGICFDKTSQQLEILDNKNVSGIQFK